MTTNTALTLDINSVNLNDQKAFGITEANREQIMQAASRIQLGDALSVHEFGRPTQDSNYLDSMLDNVRVNDQGESGKQLAHVVDLTQQISDSLEPSKVQLALRRIPVIGAMIARLTFMQRRALNRYDSVKNQMGILSTGIETISLGFMQENVKMEAMYNEVYADVQQQGINIVASQVAINSIERELKERQDDYKKDKSNTLLAMEISNIEYQLTILKKRRADMISNQQKSFDDLTMLRIIQQNNLTMVDKFRSIEEMTLPAAKRGHIIVDALEKQNSGVKLSEAIDDATNAIAIRQAELVKDNSVRIARQSHRNVYDEATLSRISKLMNETITEVKAIHKSSADNHLHLEKRAAQWQEERRSRLIEGMKQ